MLTVRGRRFAVLWMAAIHSEVLMCVRGFDVQVSANLAIHQVTFVSRKVTSSADDEAVNLMVTVDVFYENSQRRCFQLVLLPSTKRIFLATPKCSSAAR